MVSREYKIGNIRMCAYVISYYCFCRSTNTTNIFWECGIHTKKPHIDWEKTVIRNRIEDEKEARLLYNKLRKPRIEVI